MLSNISNTSGAAGLAQTPAAKPAFTFTPAAKPAFAFGGAKKAATKPAFAFGGSKEATPAAGASAKPAFAFGAAKKAEGVVAPAPESTGAAWAAAFANVEPEAPAEAAVAPAATDVSAPAEAPAEAAVAPVARAKVNLRGTPFSDFPGMPAWMKEALRKDGKEYCTPVQQMTLSALFGKADVSYVAQAETGTGKTLCFVLAILDSLLDRESGKLRPDVPADRPAVLCVLNSKEAAMQTEAAFEGLAKGLVSWKRLKSGKTQPTAANVVFCSPGVLNNHLKRGHVQLDQVHTLVVDEADTVVASSAFKDVTKKMRGLRRRLCFGATITDSVLSFVGTTEDEVLRPGPEAGLSKKVRPDIEQRFSAVKSDADRCAMLLELLPWLERNGAGKIIVYTNERKHAGSLERDLAAFRERSISVRKLTGDMRPAEREAAFKQFAHGDVRVLVTTNVLSRAIDVPGVRLVVHFDLPCRGVRLEYAEYVQRCGRAGRYMSSGMTLAFVVDDRPATRELLRQASAREASLVEVQGMDERSAQLDEVLEL